MRTVVVIAMAGLTACSAFGNTGMTTPSAAATPTTNLASTYIGMVAPVNAAYQALLDQEFADYSNYLTGSASMSKELPLISAYRDAMVTFAQQLTAFEKGLPTKALSDVERLEKALHQEVTDLNAVLLTGDPQYQAVAANVWRLDPLHEIVADPVRSDLGLASSANAGSY